MGDAIEEHDETVNPELRNYIADITKVKQEIEDDAPRQIVETWDWPKIAKKEEAVERIDEKKPATSDIIPGTYKIESDGIVSGTDKFKNVNANQIATQFYLEISKDAYDSSKDQVVTNYNIELVPKKEVVTCKVCSKETGGGEMCKGCVETAVDPCGSLDGTEEVNIDKASEIVYVCYICTTYTTVDKSDLEKHLQKHRKDISKKRNRKTPRKNVKTDRHKEKSHVKKVKNKQNTFYCDTCDYRCTHKYRLVLHLRRHTGEKPYKCDLCDYKSTSNSLLKTHKKTKHTNERNYSCNMCDYKTVSKGHLNRHLRKHTGEKPYKCDLCDYRSSYNTNLKYHVRTNHTNELDYSCNMCGYKFVCKSYLNVHLRTHTGEKPYKCDFCEYRCLHRANLKYHISSKHTNEKNFSCNLCDYKFVFKSHLLQHLRKHTGEKPYKCDLCDFRCSVSSRIKSHMKAIHLKDNN